MIDPNQNPIEYDKRPVSGFHDPDTGMAFNTDDFWTLTRKLQRHRESNKLDASVACAMALVICHVRKQQGLECDGPYSKAAILSAIGPKKCQGCVRTKVKGWMKAMRLKR